MGQKTQLEQLLMASTANPDTTQSQAVIVRLVPLANTPFVLGLQIQDGTLLQRLRALPLTTAYKHKILSLIANKRYMHANHHSDPHFGKHTIHFHLFRSRVEWLT